MVWLDISMLVFFIFFVIYISYLDKKLNSLIFEVQPSGHYYRCSRYIDTGGHESKDRKADHTEHGQTT